MPPGPQAEDSRIHEHLERILASDAFHNAERRSSLLRFLVENALSGAQNLKEYTIGLQVYERESGYDPRIDPIVRVQVGRLRAALEKYYEGQGRAEPLRISVPKGAYVPVFETLEVQPLTNGAAEVGAVPEPALSPPARFRRWKLYVAITLVAVLGTVAGVFLYGRYAQPALTSVAVLPFQNLSGDASKDYLSDGITAILTTDLTRIPGLKVVARTSASRFKGQGVDIREVGTQLGVDAVIEGSLLPSRDGVRVTAQLNRTGNGYNVWAETFQTTTEWEMSAKIAAATAPRLRPGWSPPANPKPVNRDAYNSYLRGRYFWNRRTTADVLRSIGYFRSAIAADPGYAPAFAGLADSYIVLATNDQAAPQEAFSEARTAAERAIGIDPSLSAPHAALAEISFYHDWNWPAAELEFRRSVELNPGYATAHHWFALCLTWRGQFGEAAAEIRKAQDLDPLSGVIAGTVGVVEYFARRYGEARESARKSQELDPNNYFPHYLTGLTWEAQTRYEQARPEFDAALRLAPGESENTMRLAHMLAVSGERPRALELLNRMLHPAAGMRVSPYQIAVVHAGLGDREDAVQWLEKAWKDHDPDLVMLRVDPYFDALRNDARVTRLIVP